MTSKTSLVEKDVNKLHESIEDEYDEPNVLVRREHEIFAERIRKSLYYGKFPKDDRPSLPMTEIAVSYIREAAPKELGKIDMYLASDIGRRAYVSPCSMMLGMIYIERLKHKNPDYLTQVSSSDLFLISMMVASKYLYDEGTDEEVYNDEWAEAADIDTEDVNNSEMHFLRAIDWSLFTKAEEFERLLASMEERTAFTEGYRRNSWTYGDMAFLFSNAKLLALMKLVVHEACKVVLVCSIAYTAGVVTMAASMTTLSLLRTHNPIYIAQPNSLVNTPRLTTTLDDETTDETTEEIAAELNDTFDLTEPDYVYDTLRPAELNGKRIVLSEDHLLFSRERHYKPDSKTLDKQTFGLSLPGFLTLAFFEDTVAHILKVLNINEISDVYVDENCTLDSPSKCKCSNCPVDSKQKRKTSFGHPIPPLSIWSSLKSVGRERNSTSRSNMNVKCNGQMNCKSGPDNNFERSAANKYSNQLENVKEMSGTPGCRGCSFSTSEDIRIHEGLAPDLSLGFFTTHYSSQTVLVS